MHGNHFKKTISKTKHAEWRRKMEKKRGKIKKWLFVLGGILLLAINLLYARFSRADAIAKYLTVWSGWVSGIATIIIGVIAFSQSNKQFRLDLSQCIIERREKTIQYINEEIKRFEQILDCTILLKNVKEICPMINPNLITIRQNQLESEIDNYIQSVCDECSRLTITLGFDENESDSKKELIESIKDYSSLISNSNSIGNPNSFKNKHDAEVFLVLVEKSWLPQYKKITKNILNYRFFFKKETGKAIQNLTSGQNIL